MSFADVWWDGSAVLDGVTAVQVAPGRGRSGDWPADALPFLAIDFATALGLAPWSAVVDARLAKRGAPLELRGRAPLTIGCGPGHVAGTTCDLAIETQWGERLGAVIEDGATAVLAGEPRPIEGVGRERIVYAPWAGRLEVLCDIGTPVRAGMTVASIDDRHIAAPIAGTLRGMLRSGLMLARGDKICEVDLRPVERAVFTGIGQRPAAIAEGVARALASLSAKVAAAATLESSA